MRFAKYVGGLLAILLAAPVGKGADGPSPAEALAGLKKEAEAATAELDRGSRGGWPRRSAKRLRRGWKGSSMSSRRGAFAPIDRERIRARPLAVRIIREFRVRRNFDRRHLPPPTPAG